MSESKIGLTERLRREGRWEEASRFKDEMVRKRRAEGMKRREAGERAWQDMAKAYPPVLPEPVGDIGAEGEDSAYDRAKVRLCSLAYEALDGWKREYGITLPDDAQFELIAYGLVHFWSAGFCRELTGKGKPWGTARGTNLGTCGGLACSASLQAHAKSLRAGARPNLLTFCQQPTGCFRKYPSRTAAGL